MNPAVNAGATSGAASMAAGARAIKASGAIVRVEPQDFLYILDRHEEPLVVEAQGGLFFKHLMLVKSIYPFCEPIFISSIS